MRKLFLLTIFVALYLFCQAQLESAIWQFGHYAGLDFNSGSPIVTVNSAMNTLEGCASISNANGELLFYTDGDTVYNRNHQIMTNGTGLLGHESSTQSAIIVKKPGSTHIYYIFTVDGGTGNQGGLCYSEVDMNLDGGNGAITDIKNIELIEQGDEKVCAVKHQNGQDYWIVAKVGGDNAYYSYLLTDQGVQDVPVISNIGSFDLPSLGYLKPSYDGTKIAAAFFNTTFLLPIFEPQPFAELYDFDNSTGILSNYQAIEQNPENFGDPNYHGYGIEFSPNNERLYVSAEKFIFQFDLTAGSTEDILNSRVIIASNNSPDSIITFPYMAMQLALDGKIYVASAATLNLHVINSPNELGNACNFLDDHIILDTISNFSRFGLPSFPNDYIFTTPVQPTILSHYYCKGEPTSFYIDSSFYEGTTATSFTYSWIFDDPNSGSLNTSNEPNPSHIFTNSGSYTVSLTITTDDDQSFTQEQVVNIIETNIDLGPDLNLCQNESHSFDATTPNATYLWQDGSTNPTYSTNEDELVWLEMNVDGCSARDSVVIRYVTPPKAVISLANSSCTNANIQIDITGNYPPYLLSYTNGNETYSIQCNETNTIEISEQADYTIVSIEDAMGCEGTHSGIASYNHNNINLNANFDFSPKDAYFDDATITFTNLSDYHTNAFWDFGDGNTYNELDEIVKNTYQRSGHYLVTLTIEDEFGCSGKVEKIVPILTYGFFLPNAFTPDDLGDKTNNTFGLKTDKLKSFTMMIYDRWGSELYRTSDLNKPWDGKYKNRLLPIGVYTYHTRIITLENKVVIKNGTVTLMR